MKIGDLYWALRADGAQLEPDMTKAAQQAGDSAGKTLGGRMSKALSLTLRAGLGVVAAGAGLAVKGLQELDDVQAKFRAETGASADEAEREGRAINAMGGRNLQTLSQIGDVAIKVHNDLGVVGDQADATTEQFLKFATATGQDAAGAVTDFDDILDAWNLTADHSGEIMDELIASHQKYGGEITENQKALAKMAPQLQALNADWHDGIGLLNLFAASGLDSAKALTALNTAVAKLKPGQTLDDLVKEISSIEDPTKRAQRAVEIFGAKGGVALANALRPGVTSLKDFEISATDAAGSTNKAANAALSFTDKLKLVAKQIGATVIGIGQQIGPLGSALTGLFSLGGALGLDKVVTRAFDGLKNSEAVHGAVHGAASFLGGLFSGAMEIAEKLVEFVKEGLSAIAERLGIKAAASKAGAIIGGWLGTAAASAEKLAELFTEAFTALPFAGKLRAAVLASAIELGTLQGTAFATAAAAAAAAAPAIVFLAVIKLTGFADGNTPNPLGIPQIDQGNAKWQAFKANFAQQGQDAGRQAGEATGVAYVDAAIDSASRQGQQGAEKFGDAMVAAFRKDSVVSQVVSSSIGAHVNWIKVARAQGNRAGAALAQGIRDRDQAVSDAWQLLIDTMHNALSPAKKRAQVLGELTSTTLAKALHDKRPEVREQAEATKQALIDRLATLHISAKNIGADGMAQLRKGMKSKDPDIKAAATAIYNSIHNKLGTLNDNAQSWGRSIGQGLASGLLQSIGRNIIPAALAVANAIAAFTQTHSPAKEGPLSEDGGPEGYGRNIGSGIASGLASTLPNLSSVLGGFQLPGAGSMAFAGAGVAATAPSGVTIGELHLHDIGSDVGPARAAEFGRQVMREVASNFRHEGARNGIHPDRP